ncbi:hypothetical protein GN244_ATG09976 [Phytophthora infestans]|uniref:Uncharacterized protein n=1 Tax=Phytophthora infestans TaxID=4787 RepID=A0A833TB61_PHYIN|nr:hypothetical protein GN244_ATG09976 [Phytophthora infestans]
MPSDQDESPDHDDRTVRLTYRTMGQTLMAFGYQKNNVMSQKSKLGGEEKRWHQEGPCGPEKVEDEEVDSSYCGYAPQLMDTQEMQSLRMALDRGEMQILQQGHLREYVPRKTASNKLRQCNVGGSVVTPREFECEYQVKRWLPFARSSSNIEKISFLSQSGGVCDVSEK